jgi:hypothetical protein
MLETVSRPLEVSSTIPLTAEQIERLCAIEEYDLWFVIERVERKGEIAPHLIGEAVKEFKKYMALIALGHTEIGMASQEVDEIWHNFILFTREYGEFCEKVCGRIIHHRPNTSRRPQLPDGSIAGFLSAYMKFFGDPPPIWLGEGINPLAAPADALLKGECKEGGECNTGGSAPDTFAADCDSAPGPVPFYGSSLGKCDALPRPTDPPCDSSPGPTDPTGNSSVQYDAAETVGAIPENGTMRGDCDTTGGP